MVIEEEDAKRILSLVKTQLTRKNIDVVSSLLEQLKYSRGSFNLKVHRKFLWLPKRIGTVTKWLQMASWIQDEHYARFNGNIVVMYGGEAWI